MVTREHPSDFNFFTELQKGSAGPTLHINYVCVKYTRHSWPTFLLVEFCFIVNNSLLLRNVLLIPWCSWIMLDIILSLSVQEIISHLFGLLEIGSLSFSYHHWNTLPWVFPRDRMSLVDTEQKWHKTLLPRVGNRALEYLVSCLDIPVPCIGYCGTFGNGCFGSYIFFSSQ